VSQIPFNMPLTEAFGEFVDVPAAKMVLIQADGTCPYVSRSKIDRAPSINDLKELGFIEVVAINSQGEGKMNRRSSFLSHEGGVLYMHLSTETNGSGTVSVAATTKQDADDLMQQLRERFLDGEDAPDETIVPVKFTWYASGTRSKTRMIESPNWQDVSINYPKATKDALETLNEIDANSDKSGRLLMFHGEPGTGKTTAVRALARSWSSWCSTTYIVDPETLFSVPEYLLEVALDGESYKSSRFLFSEDAEDEGAASNPKWKLIVVEDVDELIRADAKDRTGQALGRLLNLTDGLLGQGLRTMFLLTTNERMGIVHPAISRPGRCLANIEFSTFTKTQAEAWLRSRNVDVKAEKDTYTLAELYALCGDSVISAEPEKVFRTGTYL
jgi:type II secretory pathway predicted ATPase ExeA